MLSDNVLYLIIAFSLNFTLEELAVTSPAYNYFLSRIKELENKEQRLSTRKLDIDFPNYLQYERVKQLVNFAFRFIFSNLYIMNSGLALLNVERATDSPNLRENTF